MLTHRASACAIGQLRRSRAHLMSSGWTARGNRSVARCPGLGAEQKERSVWQPDSECRPGRGWCGSRAGAALPGQQATDASGLFYNYQREYDPAAGRYSQSDAIGLKGASALTLMWIRIQSLLPIRRGWQRRDVCVAAYTAGGAVCGGAAGYYGGGTVGGISGAAACSPSGPGSSLRHRRRGWRECPRRCRRFGGRRVSGQYRRSGDVFGRGGRRL
jgi:RHS repeat-associated protein